MEISKKSAALQLNDSPLLSHDFLYGEANATNEQQKRAK